MNSRERLLGAIAREPIDRIPMMESYWGSGLAKWRKEGLPDHVTDETANDYFNQDKINISYVDWSFQYEPCVVEETDEYVVSRSADNVLSKSLKNSPSMLDLSHYSVTDRKSWEEQKPRFEFNERRIDMDDCKKRFEQTRDDLVQAYMEPCLGFEKFKYCMGTENLLYTIAEDKGLILEMVEATERLALDGLEHCLGNGLEFDIGYITEDMGFSNGPFFSPAFYREVIMPSHIRYNDFLHARGMKSMLHSCGDVRRLLGMFVEAGFDILNPLEQKAGMDLFAVKRDYGDALTLWGGIDVLTISSGDEKRLHDEIRDKVTFAKKGYGYVFGSDHSIPDNIPLRTYEMMLEWGVKYGKY